MEDEKDNGLSLLELLGWETLEALRASFEACAGLALVFTDAEGRPITEVQDPARFCGAFMQGTSIGGWHEALCCARSGSRERWVAEMQAHLARTGEPMIETCPMGFLDAVVPIELDGALLGYGLFGHALESAPDPEHYRRIAEESGADPDACVEVARTAKIMPREQVLSAAKLLHTIAELVVRAADDTLQARQVRELEQTRDELTNMIVHDLRTPLAAIIGSLQTLHDGSLGHLDELTKELIGLSLTSSRRLLGMVNDLLDVSKTEAGGMTLTREPVQLRSIVDGALEQVGYLAEDRGVELRIDVPPDLPALYADREKAERVFVNLLGNAIKFTPRAGCVSVLASHPDDDEEILVGVRDTGEGIPAEDRERIFDKFAQVESRKAGRRMSTGLGLTFCRAAVEAHGGRIWVESTVGEGSTFFFTLPAA